MTAPHPDGSPSLAAPYRPCPGCGSAFGPVRLPLPNGRVAVLRGCRLCAHRPESTIPDQRLFDR